MKVLVCDDSIINCQIIGAYLAEMGHKAIYADNGTQAVTLFEEQEPDLVLIDVEMPEMDGYEATRMMRQSFNDFSQWTPIIFVSSHIDDASIVKGIEAGGDDYLTKPVSQAVLRAKIHAMRRLVNMRQNLIDFGNQLREVNDKLMMSNQLLSELSLKDPLTRLGNRRAFEESLVRASRAAIREEKPISLLMIDVDLFKSFNDTYGHQAGDCCLQQVAQVFKRGLHRATDFGARYGGEEFSIILPDTSLSGALHVAQRLRQCVEALQIPNQKASNGIITISIGVATAEPTKEFSGELLVGAADSALYEAKQTGRNCIVGTEMEPLTQVSADKRPQYKMTRHLPTTSGSSSAH